VESDDTEAGTIVIVGRGGWALLEEVARAGPWRDRRRRMRRVVLWVLLVLSLALAVWASR
jgi:hypothetical protein